MSRSPDLFPSLSGLLRKAVGPALRADAGDFLDMCAEDIVFEFPFAPPAAVDRLDGKAALAAYLPKVAELLDIESMELVASYRDADNDTFVIEFRCLGRSRVADARYDQDYISVVTLRDGLIARYRDYWNPLIVLQAAGGDGALRALMAEGDGDAA